MKGGIKISKLIFKNGQQLDLKENSIVLFVGPNNAGKSATLNEIYDDLLNVKPNKKIIDDVQHHRTGSFEDFLSNIEPQLKNGYYHGFNGSTYNADSLKYDWDNPRGRNASQFVIKKIDTISRLQSVAPPSSINFLVQVPTHPFHHLQTNDKLNAEFSEYFKSAFGQDIIVNFGAGSVVPLHVGNKPETNSKKDRVSTKYLEELSHLGQLDNQGDGMKSFVGVLLPILTQNFSILFIDEPEAFLHPPQASI
ncbi:MAG: hypothetical protein V4520_10685 [Bacteroidota bacterium]